MEFSAKQIAEFINGEIDGNPDVLINDLAKIEEGKKGALSFLSNPKYEKYIYESCSSVLIVDKNFKPSKEIDATLIRVEDPYHAFLFLLDSYKKMQFNYLGIEAPSFIGKGVIYGEGLYLGAFSYLGANCQLGKNVKVYPNSYIGENVVIGDNTIIFAGVKIYRDTQIGKNCLFHSGAVIGADGFGYKISTDKKSMKVPHIGNVIIEDDCEIGANTTIDRATMGSTVIKKGVKIDNLVQVAHNVLVGEDTRLSAQAGVAGSTVIGNRCVFGGQAAAADHLTIANGTKLGAQTGVNKSITEENTFVNGSPAMNYRESLLCLKHFHDLPNLVKRLEALEKELQPTTIRQS